MRQTVSTTQEWRLSLRLGHKQLPRRTAREGASLTERRAAHRARRQRRRRAHGAARQPSARLAHHRHQQHAAVPPVHRSPAPRTAHPNHPWCQNSPLSAVWRQHSAVGRTVDILPLLQHAQHVTWLKPSNQLAVQLEAIAQPRGLIHSIHLRPTAPFRRRREVDRAQLLVPAQQPLRS